MSDDPAVRAATEAVDQLWEFDQFDIATNEDIARAAVEAARPIERATALNGAADWFASHDDVDTWPRLRVESVLRALADDLTARAAEEMR